MVHPFSRVIRLAEELLLNKDCQEEDVQHFRQQLRFQELLLLFEHNYSSRQQPSPAQSVENTIQYLQKHYMDSITVKQLAERANVGISAESSTDRFVKSRSDHCRECG
ncbi:hypothetical protein [Paenibacillus riograndensis]|nr:hypothetical protein [Paenibacillus riograndensis]